MKKILLISYIKIILCFNIVLHGQDTNPDQSENTSGIENQATSVNNSTKENFNIAYKVLKKFIINRMIKNVAEEAKLLHPTTLKATKKFVLTEIKKARTVADEKDFLKNMGYETVDDIKKDTDINLYINFNQSINKKLPEVQEDVKKKTLETLKINIITHVMEGNDLYHFLYRRKFNNLKINFEDLQLNTLRLHEGNWYISLVENIKKITPVENKKDTKPIKIKDLE